MTRQLEVLQAKVGWLQQQVFGRKSEQTLEVADQACGEVDIQTLLVNDVNPKQFLLTYFNVCAANGGQPPENRNEFLPWNLSQEQKDAWRCPEPFP